MNVGRKRFRNEQETDIVHSALTRSGALQSCVQHEARFTTAGPCTPSLPVETASAAPPGAPHRDTESALQTVPVAGISAPSRRRSASTDRGDSSPNDRIDHGLCLNSLRDAAGLAIPGRRTTIRSGTVTKSDRTAARSPNVMARAGRSRLWTDAACCQVLPTGKALCSGPPYCGPR